MTVDTEMEYELITRSLDMPQDADFCLTVKEDGMSPYIKPGERVYIDADRAPKEFEVGLFALDGKVVLRQCCEDYTGTLHLLPANPARREEAVSFKKDARDYPTCLGCVILDKKLPPPTYY